MERWYDGLRRHRGGLPARGTVAAALVILERLQGEYSLDLRRHRAAGGTQLQGLGGRAAAEVLSRFGETRPFLAEGGRTNRGGPAEIEALLKELATTGLDQLSERDRNALLRDVGQVFLVRRVQDFHSRERVTFDLSANQATSNVIANILEQARADGKQGEVAQHLVGAKLQLRFPDARVANERATTADLPTRRTGDFELGNAAFHVTVAPGPGVIERCRRNAAEGVTPYLLVPVNRFEAARQFAEQELRGQVAVTTIEGFVGQNVGELGGFTSEGERDQLLALLLVYNHRVDAAESDKSLLIELPRPLERHADRVRADLRSRGLLDPL